MYSKYLEPKYYNFSQYHFQLFIEVWSANSNFFFLLNFSFELLFCLDICLKLQVLYK